MYYKEGAGLYAGCAGQGASGLFASWANPGCEPGLRGLGRQPHDEQGVVNDSTEPIQTRRLLAWLPK